MKRGRKLMILTSVRQCLLGLETLERRAWSGPHRLFFGDTSHGSALPGGDSQADCGDTEGGQGR